eukprot:g8022.t1
MLKLLLFLSLFPSLLNAWVYPRSGLCFFSVCEIPFPSEPSDSGSDSGSESSDCLPPPLYPEYYEGGPAVDTGDKEGVSSTQAGDAPARHSPISSIAVATPESTQSVPHTVCPTVSRVLAQGQKGPGKTTGDKAQGTPSFRSFLRPPPTKAVARAGASLSTSLPVSGPMGVMGAQPSGGYQYHPQYNTAPVTQSMHMPVSMHMPQGQGPHPSLPIHPAPVSLTGALVYARGAVQQRQTQPRPAIPGTIPLSIPGAPVPIRAQGVSVAKAPVDKKEVERARRIQALRIREEEKEKEERWRKEREKEKERERENARKIQRLKEQELERKRVAEQRAAEAADAKRREQRAALVMAEREKAEREKAERQKRERRKEKERERERARIGQPVPARVMTIGRVRPSASGAPVHPSKGSASGSTRLVATSDAGTKPPDSRGPRGGVLPRPHPVPDIQAYANTITQPGRKGVGVASGAKGVTGGKGVAQGKGVAAKIGAKHAAAKGASRPPTQSDRPITNPHSVFASTSAPSAKASAPRPAPPPLPVSPPGPPIPGDWCDPMSPTHKGKGGKGVVHTPTGSPQTAKPRADTKAPSAKGAGKGTTKAPTLQRPRPSAPQTPQAAPIQSTHHRTGTTQPKGGRHSHPPRAGKGNGVVGTERSASRPVPVPSGKPSSADPIHRWSSVDTTQGYMATVTHQVDRHGVAWGGHGTERESREVQARERVLAQQRAAQLQAEFDKERERAMEQERQKALDAERQRVERERRKAKAAERRKERERAQKAAYEAERQRQVTTERERAREAARLRVIEQERLRVIEQERREAWEQAELAEAQEERERQRHAERESAKEQKRLLERQRLVERERQQEREAALQQEAERERAREREARQVLAEGSGVGRRVHPTQPVGAVSQPVPASVSVSTAHVHTAPVHVSPVPPSAKRGMAHPEREGQSRGMAHPPIVAERQAHRGGRAEGALPSVPVRSHVTAGYVTSHAKAQAKARAKPDSQPRPVAHAVLPTPAPAAPQDTRTQANAQPEPQVVPQARPHPKSVSAVSLPAPGSSVTPQAKPQTQPQPHPKPVPVPVPPAATTGPTLRETKTAMAQGTTFSTPVTLPAPVAHVATTLGDAPQAKAAMAKTVVTKAVVTIGATTPAKATPVETQTVVVPPPSTRRVVSVPLPPRVPRPLNAPVRRDGPPTIDWATALKAKPNTGPAVTDPVIVVSPPAPVSVSVSVARGKGHPLVSLPSPGTKGMDTGHGALSCLLRPKASVPIQTKKGPTIPAPPLTAQQLMMSAFSAPGSGVSRDGLRVDSPTDSLSQSQSQGLSQGEAQGVLSMGPDQQMPPASGSASSLAHPSVSVLSPVGVVSVSPVDMAPIPSMPSGVGPALLQSAPATAQDAPPLLLSESSGLVSDDKGAEADADVAMCDRCSTPSISTLTQDMSDGFTPTISEIIPAEAPGPHTTAAQTDALYPTYPARPAGMGGLPMVVTSTPTRRQDEGVGADAQVGVKVSGTEGQMQRPPVLTLPMVGTLHKGVAESVDTPRDTAPDTAAVDNDMSICIVGGGHAARVDKDKDKDREADVLTLHVSTAVSAPRPTPASTATTPAVPPALPCPAPAPAPATVGATTITAPMTIRKTARVMHPTSTATMQTREDQFALLFMWECERCLLGYKDPHAIPATMHRRGGFTMLSTQHIAAVVEAVGLRLHTPRATSILDTLIDRVNTALRHIPPRDRRCPYPISHNPEDI